MYYFNYKARNLLGDEITGEYYGDNCKELSKKLRQQGYFIIKSRKKCKYILSLKKITAKDLSTMCKQLSSMLLSGINIIEAFNLLIQETNNRKLKATLIVIKEEVCRGKELSLAMAKFDKIYPNFMINMIRVGEQSGNLDRVLNELSQYYLIQNRFIAKIKKVLTYPIIVFIITNIVILLIMFKVMPIFYDMFISLGIELPQITKFFMTISYLIRKNKIVLLGFNLLFILCICKFKKTKFGTAAYDKLKLNTPLFNKVYKKNIQAKFIHGLAILLESGVTIIKAMDIVIKIINSISIEKKLNSCIQDIKEGKSISYSLKNSKVFDPIVISMVRIGEESGNISEMLLKIAELLDEEISDSVDIISIYIEPILILVLSILVAMVIFSIMFPMLQLMQNIDKI